MSRARSFYREDKMSVMGDALDVMQFNALPRNSRLRLDFDESRSRISPRVSGHLAHIRITPLTFQ